MEVQSTIQALSSEGNSIFVKGLSKGTTERCIQGLFGKFGKLIDCQASVPMPLQ